VCVPSMATPPTLSDARLRHEAHRHFGYDELLPGQADAVRALVSGRDTLVVMPTASGKSAVYQLAGLLIDGPTVVVSPLIALQRDQVSALDELGVGNADEANSTRPDRERREALEAATSGDVEFLFLAPEQLFAEGTLDALRRRPPSLVAVDEAHCVSAWGHDFRPAYLRLGSVIAELGHPVVVALTATAAPPVRDDICRSLGLRDPELVVRGFDRPNLHLSAVRLEDESSKRAALLDALHRASSPGIVYSGTRRNTEELAELLRKEGWNARAYHAGLGARRRHEIQDAFMRDALDVVVATTAFGMGIDKPNVRFVFHHQASDSLDAYYQEIGRAGRDGETAAACLFFLPEDLSLRRFLGGRTQVHPEHVVRVVAALNDIGMPTIVEDATAGSGLSRRRTTAVLNLFQQLGAVEVTTSGEVFAGPRSGELDAVASEAIDAEETRRKVRESRLEMMRAFGETNDCRRQVLLPYFGEPFEERCGFCDNCESGRSTAGERNGTFETGTRVEHREWGRGSVLRSVDERVVVLFDDAGYKTLSLPVVLEERLLERV
ncbi:MAG TPA: ATP-dependent DNA helicase RecQ, partial [Acidimicrobiia bacterium]|nr:ATP-dependent DNA helicase RecQ [Acidimicrobiia bacterium]